MTLEETRTDLVESQRAAARRFWESEARATGEERRVREEAEKRSFLLQEHVEGIQEHWRSVREKLGSVGLRAPKPVKAPETERSGTDPGAQLREVLGRAHQADDRLTGLVQELGALRAAEAERKRRRSRAVRLGLMVGIPALLVTSVVVVVRGQMERARRAQEEAFQRELVSVRGQLPGRWMGTIRGRPARLSIEEAGGRPSGMMTHSGVEQDLTVDLGRAGVSVVVILAGTAYRRVRGQGNYYLDTFYATMSADGGSMQGNFRDRAGQTGPWSAVKCRTAPLDVSGDWEGEWRLGGIGIRNPLGRSQGRFRLSLEQEGFNLQGAVTYVGVQGRSIVSGEVCENQIRFEYPYRDGRVREYIGVLGVRSERAEGSWDQRNGSGTWSMARSSTR